MSWSLVLSLLGALPQVLKLFNSIADLVATKTAQGMGRAQAVAEALDIASKEISRAQAAERAAVADHEAHPNDDQGFDSDFKRG